MQGGTIQNVALKINALLVLLENFHYQSFCNSGKIFFLGLPLANVVLSIVPISLWESDTLVSNVSIFIKLVYFLLVRKLPMHVGYLCFVNVVS